MAYEVVMPYHLHMPSYFLETFTEYPKSECPNGKNANRFVINSGEHEHTGSSLWWIISLFFLFHFPNLFLFYFAQ